MNAQHSLLEEYNLKVEVRTLPDTYIACMRYTGDYSGCGSVHGKLCEWVGKNGLFATPRSILNSATTRQVCVSKL